MVGVANLVLHILDHADNSLESSSIHHLRIIRYDLPTFPQAQRLLYLERDFTLCQSVWAGISGRQECSSDLSSTTNLDAAGEFFPWHRFSLPGSSEAGCSPQVLVEAPCSAQSWAELVRTEERRVRADRRAAHCRGLGSW